MMSDRDKFEVAMRGINRIDDYLEHVKFWDPEVTVDQMRERILLILGLMTDEFERLETDNAESQGQDGA